MPNSEQAGAAVVAETPFTYASDVPVPRALRNILCLDDFEAPARRCIPRPIFGYVVSGAERAASIASRSRRVASAGASVAWSEVVSVISSGAPVSIALTLAIDRCGAHRHGWRTVRSWHT